MSKLLDITGQTFGNLTVLYRDGYNSVGRFTWKCSCTCGKDTWATSNQLKSGRKLTCGCSKKLPNGEGNLNWIFGQYKYSAKAREIKFTLSKEQFKDLTSRNCYYCGFPPSTITTYRGSNGIYKYNGVDRINNSKGYTSDNCVPCCDMCNKAKNKHSKDKFLEWISSVFIHSIQMNKEV